MAAGPLPKMIVKAKGKEKGKDKEKGKGKEKGEDKDKGKRETVEETKRRLWEADPCELKGKGSEKGKGKGKGNGSEKGKDKGNGKGFEKGDTPLNERTGARVEIGPHRFEPVEWDTIILSRGSAGSDTEIE